MRSKGTFREDLYYRLNVIPLRMPPLRDRIEDLPDLVRFLLRRCNVKFRKNVQGIADSTLRILGAYWWPGNIRELENLIERLVAISDKEWITDEDLASSMSRSSTTRDRRPKTCSNRRCRRSSATSSFGPSKRGGWNVTATARTLGIPLSTLKFKMDRLEIREIARKIRGN